MKVVKIEVLFISININPKQWRISMKSEFYTILLFLFPLTLLSSELPEATFKLEVEEMEFSLTFDSDSTYVVAMNGQVAANGIYSTINDTLTMHDMSGERSCPELGTYCWKFQEGKLTLTVISDGCEGRVKALTAGTWMLKE